MIKCFHGYPTVKEASAFISHSIMRDLMDSTVGNTVLHRVCSQWRKLESDAVSGYKIPFNRGSGPHQIRHTLDSLIVVVFEEISAEKLLKIDNTLIFC